MNNNLFIVLTKIHLLSDSTLHENYNLIPISKTSINREHIPETGKMVIRKRCIITVLVISFDLYIIQFDDMQMMQKLLVQVNGQYANYNHLYITNNHT